MKRYAAVRNDALEYINEGTDIDAVLVSGCDIWCVDDDDSHTVVYTAGEGWLVDRPSDDELRGLRKFTASVAMGYAEIARLIKLSIENTDAASKALEEYETEGN